MMELSHSLTLNEDALNQIAEAKRPVFIFEWLRFLDKVLVAAQKSDIKGCQKKLVEQLAKQIHSCPGPPTRQLIARCLATLFSVGDTFLLFDTINKCNDILKNKDDSPSQLTTKLAAITCIGAMYQKLGRMMGRSYEETIQILLKCLRNAESQARWEIMNTLEKICMGMENAVSSVAKEVYKAARHCLTDRVMSVRCAAARCLLEMMKHTTFLYTTELESLTSLCFRAFEGSNYDVRCTVGKLLGVMMATTQDAPKTASVARMRSISLEEALCMMMAGFLRGGMSFLKAGAGEMIKGTSGVSRDIRVGVTHAYVTFVDTLGSVWLEKNKNQFLLHVMELVSNPKAASSHVDAVYSRKCVSFMLRSVIGRMLNEKAQLEACKDLGHIISAQINTHDLSVESGNGVDQMYSQHALICALQELGSLFLSLGTTASLLTTESRLVVLEPVLAVLLHPAPAARLAAAWCLRCMALAIPSQLTPLIDKCLEKLETLKGSPEAISGYSSALAALLGAAKLCHLGIPHARGKIVFNAAEDLLRSASQNSRLSLQRTHAGWLLIGAVMTLGFSVVRNLLPRMLLIWRISFPRSARELESEIARGDAFTWHVTLEGRAGALSSIHSFLTYCPELVNPDVIRRILTPLESALAMMCSISNVIKTYSHNLKASSALLRFRLYEALSVLPPQAFESSYNTLLRFLVAEFTLTENPANTTTSLLRDVCHADDSAILGSWLQETDHKSLEDQLQPNSSSGSSALEHDPTALYRSASQDDLIPGSLPLGISVINASVTLFGSIFPRVPYKHRLKMLEHFSECIRQNKSVRQEAVQINIFTAVLSGMKGLAETKTNFGQDDVRKSAVALVLGAMTHSNPLLRWAAGEALGRMAQVVGDSRFVAEVAQSSFDKLKSARDVASRTGHSLALGCVHRYVGSMGSSQHLNTSVSILLALAQDSTSPVVQAWALYALALIADSGGPMFRAYVEPTLSLSLKLLLNVPVAHVDVLQCLGKCLSALITTIGPELHGNTSSVCTARSSFLCICAVLQEHPDPLVQSEAIACLQQLHMFAPRHVNLSSLVPALCRNLISPHLLLRRAAVSCLRQLAQREAKEVGEHASTVLNESSGLLTSINRKQGLPGLLFSMLDIENDKQLVSDIHDTLTSMLQALAEGTLSQWLSLCKDVLTSTAENGGSKENNRDGEGQDNEAEISDESRFHAREENATHPTIIPRWKTRVFAAESVCRIFNCCVGIRAHFDLSLARDYQGSNSGSDFLVLHLSDIVRIAFMAATSDSDHLRLEGLRMLQLIIDKFAVVPEPEFPGHVILEQYQAQVGAALRPAFSEETPSHVTAMACQVCSTWIGSKVARDLNDLRRVHQLLVSSLAKLKGSSTASQLYNESTATLEKLAILKAWAEVYVVAMEESVEDQDNCSRESLLSLVSPELPSLSSNWLSALRDHAILSLGPDATSIQRNEGGAFYSADTMDSARIHYQNSWIPILHAASLWLNNVGFSIENDTKEGLSNKASNDEEINIDRFHLIFGICMEALCSPRSTEPLECVIVCLQALYKLLDSIWSRTILGNDHQLSIELCNVLHRLLLTRENLSAQLKVMNVLMQVMTAASESLATKRKKKLKEIAPANQEPKEAIETTALMGEGGECGSIVPGKSVVFAILEVCVCVLVRQMPALNPSLSSAATVGPIINHSKRPALSNEGSSLVAASIRIMADLPSLCSPNGSLSILPTVLYLTSGVLKELVTRDVNNGSITLTSSDDTSGISLSEPLSSTLQTLKQFASSSFLEDKTCGDEWKNLLRSLLDKILDISKTSSEQVKVDEVNMIIAIAVFIVAAPADVVSVPNLQFPCLNLFKQAFESNNIQVRIKTAQALKSVFQHRDRVVATPYIQTLGAKMFEYLCSSEAANPSSDLELEFNIECLHSLEVVVGLAEPEHCKKILSLAIPIFLKFLLDPDELSNANKWRKALHENALHKLMRIGPLYPQEFCTVMSSMPQLKLILEKSIITAKENNTKMNGSSVTQSNNLNSASNQRAPSIKLKTDFSNFSLK